MRPLVGGHGHDVLQRELGGLGLPRAGLARYENALVTARVAEATPRAVSYRVSLVKVFQ